MRGLTKTKASAVPQSPRTGGGDVNVTLMVMKKAADAAGRTRIFYRSAATPGCQSLPANPELSKARQVASRNTIFVVRMGNCID
jgi:hypothetical protein